MQDFKHFDPKQAAMDEARWLLETAARAAMADGSLPEKELHYKVFAAVPYDNRHILYTYDFTSKRRYNAFLNSIFDVREIGAQHSTDVPVTPEDKLLILSTCLQGNSHRRFLVVAKCVDEVE